MDIEQLTAALADDRHCPDADSVLRVLDGKRRRRRERRVRRASALVLCAAAAVVALVFVVRPGAQPNMTASGPAAGGAAAPVPGGAGSARTAAGASAVCGPGPLAGRLAAAASAGASAVTAILSPNGSSPAGYVPVRLLSVRTLHGPRVPSGITAWLPAADASDRAGGPVFALVWPAGEAGGPGQVLTAARVRGGEVLFGASACWGGTDVPLATVERLAAGG